MHDPDASQPGRGDEPGQIGRRAPADPDDGIAPREARGAESIPAGGEDSRGLRILSLGDIDQRDGEALIRKPRPKALGKHPKGVRVDDRDTACPMDEER